MTLTPEQIQAYRQKYGIGQDSPASSPATPGSSGVPSPEERIAKLKASAEAPAPTPEAPGVSQETPIPEAPKSIFSKVGGFAKDIAKDAVNTLLVKPAARTAEAVGRTGILGDDIKKGYEIMADEGGQDINLGPIGNYKVDAVKAGMSGAKQIAGEAAQSAAYLYGGGGTAGAAKSAFQSKVAPAILRGAKVGAVGGALGAGGKALEQDKSAGEVATDALGGAVIGGVAGGAIPAVTGAVGKVAKGFGARAETRATEEALLRSGAPDSRVATKTLNDMGKIVDDPRAKELVKQGVPEADVALIKGGSATDKAKMAKMLEIRERQMTNKAVNDRATDVVGDTFVEKIAKPIEKLNKEAGKKLEVVARSLAGKKINPTKAVVQFSDALDQAGVTTNSKGELNFKNSNFEGLKGPQALINNVWKRAVRVAKSGDALQAHRLKAYIDEIVNYGKQSEGLSAKAEHILKSFRHNVDGILDSKFPAYNKVNTQFAETVAELDNMGIAIGRRFKLGDTFADTQAGVSMRKIMSNTQSRADILKLLENMQKVGKKYGIEIDEDITTQAKFADFLEKEFGSEAPTSFLGQGERFGNQAIKSTEDALNGGVMSAAVKGTIRAGKYAIDLTRGVNQENRVKALKALLGALEKPKSVFGKK